jgi:hypothetical protein
VTEPTRPIRQPVVDTDGSLVAHTVATPKSFKVRARVTVGSRKVIPVIFVPGIMGTNLRVRTDVPLPSGLDLQPGDPAWRPPNGKIAGWKEASKWGKRDPVQRQWILDGAILEVDDSGELDYSTYMLSAQEMRERGWGEIHAGSYGDLLVQLQRHLDNTFWVNSEGRRAVREHWKRVMSCDPARWGVPMVQAVTEGELEKYAAFQYPVYAVGYNWLESCAVSAVRLRKRIDEIKKFWTDRKHECQRVILITHSMGGFVARACAKMNAKDQSDPGDIAGIIHGVMPALGAPVAYRRIASGTEGKNFANDFVDNLKATKFAEIAGETAAATTPVMAVSPGALQLLPTHLYPKPWLLIKTVSTLNQRDSVRDLLSLPSGNPYDLYRDMDSWYRMIDPQLADPADKYTNRPGGVKTVIVKAIDEAERFHTETLTTTKTEGTTKVRIPYYHPNTSAFYGADEELRTYGQIRWVAREPAGTGTVLTKGNLRTAKLVGSTVAGVREVEVEGRCRLQFQIWPQDEAGDETVPHSSGNGATAYIIQTFATRGYRHQESFAQADMLLLTRHLIVKIVQGFQ